MSWKSLKTILLIFVVQQVIIQDYLATLPPLCYIESAGDFKAIPWIKRDAFEYLRQAGKTNHVTRLVFVRHAQTESNVKKEVAGRREVNLTDLGREQAKETGSKFKNFSFKWDAIYSSPSSRAVETASIILKESQDGTIPSISTDERLYEKSYGIYDGMTQKAYEPLKKREELYNSGREKSFKDKFTFVVDKEIEPLTSIYARAHEFIEEVEKRHLGKNIFVATHGGFLKTLFIALSAQQSYEIDYRKFELKNCAVLVIEVKNGKPFLVASHGLEFKSKD